MTLTFFPAPWKSSFAADSSEAENSWPQDRHVVSADQRDTKKKGKAAPEAESVDPHGSRHGGAGGEAAHNYNLHPQQQDGEVLPLGARIQPSRM
ncbi:hypothetical protein AGIG_G22335 [Arapaima gigas]